MKQLIHTLALLIALPIAQAQIITNFTPKNGIDGTTITITASAGGFDAAAYWVQFGAGTFVAATIADATEITADVPTDAAAGDISVSSDAAGSTVVAETSSLSDDFRYVSITGFTADTNPIESGSILTFTGTGFEATTHPTLIGFYFSVSFTSAISCTGKPSILTATTAMVEVPVCAQSGDMSVSLVGRGSYNTSHNIEVTGLVVLAPDPVVVKSFTPSEAAVGQRVEITGTGFATTATDNVVDFNNGDFDTQVEGIVTESNGDQTLTVRVPKSAVDGQIKVKAGGSGAPEGSSTDSFDRLDHTATGFEPTTFALGEEVTVTGTNFSTRRADNEVCFNATCIEASAVKSGGTELTVTSPSSNPRTGTLKVRIGSVEVDAGAFTLTRIAPLVFDDFNPKTVRVGQEITIEGSGFDPGTVFFPHRIASPSSISKIFTCYDINEAKTQMKARIPLRARGDEAVLITATIAKCVRDCDAPAGSRVNDIQALSGLVITPSATLEITGFSPNPVRTGEVLTVTGTGFSLNPHDSFVRFGESGRASRGNRAHEVNSDGTELKVRVHPGANNGQLFLIYYNTGNGSVEVNSSESLTISNPTRVVNDDFTPASGGPGREITINGSGFPLFAEYIEVCFAYDVDFTAKFVTAHWVNGDGTQLKAIIGNNPSAKFPMGVAAYDLPVGVRTVGGHCC